MNRLPILALAMLLPSGAYAINDTTVSAVGNDNSAIGIGGSVNGSILNNNSGNSTTTAGPINNASSATASSNSTNRNSNRQRQQQGQGQGQTQHSTSNVDDSGNSSNSYVNKTAASSAIAAPLIAADDTCMGSTSAGAQGIGFGVSLGSTWQDTDCVRRKDARELHNMGLRPAAVALMCQNSAVHNAMAAAGTPCPSSVEPMEESEPNTVYEYPSQTREGYHR